MEGYILNQTHTLRVALITGAAQRIGAAVAKTLHEKGFKVIIHYHQSEKEAFQLVDNLNQQQSQSAISLQANLIEVMQIRQLVEKAYQWQHQLDVLVNNASVFIRTPIQENFEQAFDLLWATNVRAPLVLSETCFPLLSQRKGSIVNITDIHADSPIRDYGIYCQTKAALKMQTQALAKEYAPSVRVNAVAPGAILWPTGENTLSAAQKSAIIQKTPLNCHGNPLWIAEGVLALIENPFITGQTLRIDGGRSLLG